jgi:hypothetical protein
MNNRLNLLQNSEVCRISQEKIYNPVLSQPVHQNILNAILFLGFQDQLVNHSEPLQFLLDLLAFCQEPADLWEDVLIDHILLFFAYLHYELEILFRILSAKL